MTAEKALELLNDVEFSEKYQGAWKDNGICYACREQIWTPRAPHRKVGEED